MYDSLTDRLFGAPGLWRIRACNDRGCRSLWLDPRPTRGDIGKAYAHYYTHGEGRTDSLIKRAVKLLSRERAAVRFAIESSRFPWPVAHALNAGARIYPGLTEHLDLMTRYLPPPVGVGHLLDVGCGDGEALDILRDIGWTVTGVELDPNAVSAAKRRMLDVRQGDLHSAGFADQSFDAVTSSHVIEHVHDPLAMLCESRRILKPGGKIVVVTPNAEAWTHAKYERDWLALDPPRHLMVLTASSLASLARQAGLRSICVTTTARAVALAALASKTMRDEGHYGWGAWPGIGSWLQAQLMQWYASMQVGAGRMNGEELVLVAER
jgi:SAM-dependent methyltransferase